ncbi:MAG: DUF4956 domain-containing protein [Planctomycetota bacterium]
MNAIGFIAANRLTLAEFDNHGSLRHYTCNRSGFVSTSGLKHFGHCLKTNDNDPAQPDMEFLEVPFFDDDLYKMLVRFAFNLAFAVLVVSAVYSRRHHTRNNGFTFILMNIVVFVICFVLKKLELELGMALGLFAIFSILRYRTDTMKVHDMTYLFVLVGIAVINALSNRKTSYVELLFANATIALACYLLDSMLLAGRVTSCIVMSDRCDLIAADKSPELLLHIQKTTGLQVSNIEIDKVDLKSGKVQLTVFYVDGSRQ